MLTSITRRAPQISRFPTLIARRREMSSTPITGKRPPNWKDLAPEPLPGTPTFAAQASLPKLPVPDLSATLDRLKDSLKPIAWSDDEYESVVKKIDEFASGKGPELHQRLLKRHGETKHWLESWWDDAGYLGYRDSVCLCLSWSIYALSDLSNVRSS